VELVYQGEGDKEINSIESAQPSEETVTSYNFKFNCRLSSQVEFGVVVPGDSHAIGFNRCFRERLQETPRRHPKLAGN